jgi:hypothetical protein
MDYNMKAKIVGIHVGSMLGFVHGVAVVCVAILLGISTGTQPNAAV